MYMRKQLHNYCKEKDINEYSKLKKNCSISSWKKTNVSEFNFDNSIFSNDTRTNNSEIG